MICFKGSILHSNFKTGKPKITGSGVGAWRESKERTLSAFLNSNEDCRQPCFMFVDMSGPDVFFLVRFSEDFMIPCFCQLKYQSMVLASVWTKAKATTNPERMYKKPEHPESRESLLAAYKNGCICLVVAYPAKKAHQVVLYCMSDCLVGYIGLKEMEILFDKELCAFLRSLEKELTTEKVR
jgi:hypothetical protein